MKSFIQIAACAAALLQTFVSGSPVPRYFQKNALSRRDLSAQQVLLELGPQLSNSSLIFGQSDPRYANATERWNNWSKPEPKVIVQPGLESDIPTIVTYCNENSIEFLAIARGHSITVAPGYFTGLQISMASLTGIEVADDRETAWAQGGIFGYLVIEELWKHDLVAATGSCTCVSLLGPGLGGGHGRWEGFYGMVSDNFLQFNMVLANGSAITVNRTSHPDLYWGMRGAGHNFGIVTSVQIKVHPRGPPTWHWHNYVWTQDKLEQVFDVLNTFHNNGSTPVNMLSNWGIIQMNETISATEPIIWWTFGYAGPASDAEALLEPFNAIGAAFEESGDVPYPEMPVVQQTNYGGPLCAPGPTRITSTANLQVFNLTTERAIYNSFVSWKAQYPQFKDARIVQEAYSDLAVHTNFDPADSAYPQRDQHHLNLFELVIDGFTDLAPQARQWANEVLDLWNGGQPDRTPSTYVNYANGLESVESMYGPEPWRIEKLLGLKAAYDPNNSFRFYNPIIPGTDNPAPLSGY